MVRTYITYLENTQVKWFRLQAGFCFNKDFSILFGISHSVWPVSLRMSLKRKGIVNVWQYIN